MKTKAQKRILVVVLAILLLPALASAFEVISYLDQNNIGLTGGPWASVTLSDKTAGGLNGVHFVVDPIDSAFTSVGRNFGLQTFYFNENTGFGSDLIIDNPNGWTYSYSSDPSYNAGGNFGKFEFRTTGDGNNRLDPLVFDVFAPGGKPLSIANLSTVLSSEGYLFAGHIADFNGGESAKFSTVPIPSAAWLLGSGVIALLVLKRKKPTA